MKLQGLLAVACLIGGLPVAGCTVTTSEHPFADPKIVEFDPALVGEWRNDPNAGDKRTIVVRKSGNAAAYELAGYERPDTDRRNDFGRDLGQAVLIRLGKSRFLERTTVSVDAEGAKRELFELYKFSIDGDKVTLVEMNVNWLKAEIQKNKLAVRARIIEAPNRADGGGVGVGGGGFASANSPGVRLSANTTELQEFVVKYEKELFKSQGRTFRRISVPVPSDPKAQAAAKAERERADREAAAARVAKAEAAAQAEQAARLAAIPGMIKRLSAPDAEIRRRAAADLGKIGPEAAAATGALSTVAAGDSNEYVRKAAAEALKKIGSAAK